MKNKDAKKPKTFTMEVIEALVNGEIDIVIQDIWVSCIKHVGNLQAGNHSNEIRSNKILASAIVNLQESDTEHRGSTDNDDNSSRLFVSLISFVYIY